MEKLLEVKDLEVHFACRTGLLNTLLGKEKRGVRAVDGISFDLQPGEILGLAGESGSGKTTTGKAILRLIEPTGGQINFQGEEVRDFSRERLRKFRRDAQIILQDPFESLNPRHTVYRIVSEPLIVNGITHNLKEQEEIVDQALIDAGLDNPRLFYYRYPHELSGGQRQRVAIASTLVLNPKLVVADEPVSMLDLSISAGVVKLMVSLRDERKISYLFITHELSLAWLVADRIGVMYLGKIVELGTADQIIKSPLHPYTKALVAVIPIPKKKVIQNTKLLKGETPDPINIPSGCRFHPRCPVAQPRCREAAPVYREIEKGRFVACHEVN
ncbi:MAG: ABC transporter ATP-binding protein [Dehalobacterium sp.]